MDSEEPSSTTQAFESAKKYGRLYQTLLDRTTPHTLRRWAATVSLFLLFFIRIVWIQAFYIVCYALGYVCFPLPLAASSPDGPPPFFSIYLLNLFLAFLQPKFDPSLAADLAETEVEEGAPGLPTSMPSPASNGGTYGEMQDGEFRPFIRRLPEFKFWYSATKAIVFSMLATLFPVFDIPVFWPILLVYFCILFFITMRRQIGHMRRYKYLPFDIGRKAQYGR
ncbi:Golgi membrane protein [Pseudohyphozyma bogoriensis]|nr:Golgi membrane protein [Pseudohyphozyma bogoriensis]